MGSGSNDPTSIKYICTVHQLKLGFFLSRIPVSHKLILMHMYMKIVDYFQPIVGFLSSKRWKSKTGRRTDLHVSWLAKTLFLGDIAKVVSLVH
jgi:hypothetical protein